MKKGLSTIVATLLILLLIFVAVGIIWVVVRNVIQEGAEQVSLGKFTLDLKISQVQIINDSSIRIKIKRNPGAGDFVALNFVIDDGTNSEVIKLETSLNELQEMTYILILEGINASNIKSIKIAPVFKLESGKEVIGPVKDEYEVSKITGVSQSGKYVFLSCSPNYEDCNSDNSDGCESYLLSNESCGECGNKCGDNEECILIDSMIACLPICSLTGDICLDTDGGYDFFEKGIRSFCSGGVRYSNADSCVGYMLNEQGCVGNNAVSDVYTCPGFCENGKCINESFLDGYEDRICEPLSTNSEGDDKVNVLFIIDNLDEFNLEYFKTKLQTHVNAFYSIEPFKSHKDITNFYILSSTKSFFEDGSLSIAERSMEKAEFLSSICPYEINQYLIVIDENKRVYSTLGGGIAITTIYQNYFPTIHEFGHSFAGLTDTYYPFMRFDGTSNLVLVSDSNNAPNVDEAGCSKWCDSNEGFYETACTKITNETECKTHNRIPNEYGGVCLNSTDCCVWLNDDAVDPFFNSRCVNIVSYKNIGIDCLEGTGCYYGTYYPGSWRAIEEYGTIMGGGGNEFDPISYKAIEMKFDCCYPQDCSNFPLECAEYSEKYPNAFGDCGTCNI